MLNSSDDYREIDVQGVEEAIDSKILPERLNLRDGTGRILRYVDILFLKEGKMERYRWKGPSERERESRPSRRVSKNEARAAAVLFDSGISGAKDLTYGDWCDAEIAIGEGDGWDGGGTAALKRIYDEGSRLDVIQSDANCDNVYVKLLGAPELEEVEIGGAVGREAFLAAYRNLTRLTRTNMAMTGKIAKGRTDKAVFDEDGGTVSLERGEWYEEGATILNEYASNTACTVKEVKQELPELPTCPYAARAWLVANVEAYYEERGSDEDGREVTKKKYQRAYFAAAELAVGDGGAMSWKEGTLDAIADAALSEMGVERRSQLTPFGGDDRQASRSCTVSVGGSRYIVVDHVFPGTPPAEGEGGE